MSWPRVARLAVPRSITAVSWMLRSIVRLLVLRECSKGEGRVGFQGYEAYTPPIGRLFSGRPASVTGTGRRSDRSALARRMQGGNDPVHRALPLAVIGRERPAHDGQVCFGKSGRDVL